MDKILENYVWRKSIFSNMEAGESPPLSQTKVFNTRSSKDFDQIFSYFLIFLKTLRTHLFNGIFFMAACEIETKTREKC